MSLSDKRFQGKERIGFINRGVIPGPAVAGRRRSLASGLDREQGRETSLGIRRIDDGI